jgi:hypothetical protein
LDLSSVGVAPPPPDDLSFLSFRLSPPRSTKLLPICFRKIQQVTNERKHSDAYYNKKRIVNFT